MPEFMHCFNIPFKNVRCVRKCLYSAINACFPQEMQGWIGGSVGIVFDVVRLSISELVLWVETGNLNFPFQSKFKQCRVGELEEVIEVQKIVQHAGVDEQASIHIGRIGSVQL